MPTLGARRRWVLYAALGVRPENPELTARGYTRYADAAFTTISAFANAGFVLASTNWCVCVRVCACVLQALVRVGYVGGFVWVGSAV